MNIKEKFAEILSKKIIVNRYSAFWEARFATPRYKNKHEIRIRLYDNIANVRTTAFRKNYQSICDIWEPTYVERLSENEKMLYDTTLDYITKSCTIGKS